MVRSSTVIYATRRRATISIVLWACSGCASGSPATESEPSASSAGDSATSKLGPPSSDAAAPTAGQLGTDAPAVSQPDAAASSANPVASAFDAALPAQADAAAPTQTPTAASSAVVPSVTPPSVVFERQVLSLDYVAEGATFGDFNRDGSSDVVAGSHWYEGPEFTVAHEFREPAVFDPLSYTDSFFAFTYDFNSDGWSDVFTYGFPGESAAWYENPKGEDQHWARHETFSNVDNEAPAFVDLLGDAKPEMVFNSSGFFGWAAPPNDDYVEPFEFHAISEQGGWERFTHGLGVGDVDGDGLNDVLGNQGVWFQPSVLEPGVAWRFESHDLGAGGAQMYAYDVDGDGDQDIITSLEAHGYGLSWFEQVGEAGARQFEPHVIAGTPDAPGPSDIVLHQPHALTLIDVDGDSLLDIVTGERFWGHVPDPPDFSAPALLVWFRLVRDASGANYEGHVIDDASGVGTQVVAQTLEGHSHPSIVTANKKGVFVFRPVQGAP